MRIILIAIFLSTGLKLSAQNTRRVTGKVQDTTGTGVIAAGVKLKYGQDSIFAQTDVNGNFAFNQVKSSQFLITVSSLGYKTLNKRFLYPEANTPITLEPIILKQQENLLDVVVVNGTPSVTVKEDTVEYRAKDYAVRENSVAEDVLKKLPGVEVDKDGNVKAQGQNVTKIRVNGKDFFNGDVKTATRELPAELIEKIQVIDDYGDQANLTGVREGDAQKIINITISRANNKGVFGQGTVGGGNEGRYQAGVSANIFNNEQQVSFMGNLNNTNAPMFNMGGEGVSFGGRGGGGRGGAGGGGGDGITKIGSAGINYRDEWGKKLTTYGSYSFSNRDNSVLRSSFEERNSPIGPSSFITSGTDANSGNTGHRFNWNLEYRADSLNYFKFTPSFNYSSNDGKQFESSLTRNGLVKTNAGTTIESVSVNTPSFGGNLLYNHQFRKKGRNFSINGGINNSENTNDRDVNDHLLSYSDSGALTGDLLQHQLLELQTKSLSANAEVSHIEPIGKRTGVELSWRYTYTKYDNDRITSNINPAGVINRIDSLSNIYDYSFATNRFGLTYRFREKNYNYSVGISAQPTVLAGNWESQNISTRRTGFNLFPVARFEYKFSRTKSFNINYSGRSTEPTFTQIQPIPDKTNLQNPVYGNQDLQAEFSQTLNLRFNNFDAQKGTSLFTNLSARYTDSKIVNNVINRRDSVLGLIRETYYLNEDGFYTVSGFYSYSKPFAEKKYTVSFNGSANYSNNLSYTDNIKNLGKNTVLSQGLRLQVNPNKNLELNPSVNYSYNRNTYSLTPTQNQTINTWSLNADGRLYFFKTFIIGFDVSKNFNNGYSGNLSQNPLIINSYLEKQFLKDKSATFRLQGFDLLKEGLNISRTISNNSITDSQSNRLTRYFLLSFTMRIRKFNGQSTAPRQNFPGGGRDGNFRGGDRGGFGRPPGGGGDRGNF